jgi:DNA-binding transcriptional MerR regulator
MTQDKKLFKINRLAKELGLSIQTLKNYESRGILPKAKRDSKKWRYYTYDDIVKIKALYEQELKKRNRV